MSRRAGTGNSGELQATIFSSAIAGITARRPTSSAARRLVIPAGLSR